MDDLKNCRPGAKTKKERGKKREEKKMVVSDKPVNLFMQTLLFHGEHVETHWEQP
jgi:hypothetical protein